MHLSHVPHYSGCLSHLGQLATNQARKDKVWLSAGNPQRAERATSLPNFSVSNFPENVDIILGLCLSTGLMTPAVVRQRAHMAEHTPPFHRNHYDD